MRRLHRPFLVLLPLLLRGFFATVEAFAVRPTALITGGNRGLGKATAELLVDVGFHVILTARNEAEGRACVRSLQDRARGGDKAGGSSSSSSDDAVADFFPFDVAEAEQRTRLAAYLAEHPKLRHADRGGVPDLVINNAGVCIRGPGAAGRGRAAFERSLAVNTWGPVRLLTDVCLPRMRRRGHGCVINISSGDGELAYLHSEVAGRLRAMRSLEELELYTAQVTRAQPQGDDGDSDGDGDGAGSSDVAHLPWAAYCFSKAALNVATRLLDGDEAAHRRQVAGTAADPMLGRVRRGERGVRVVALCPGDVATDMCDFDPTQALTPEQAALDVVWAALHPAECPGGHFYRARERIEW